MKNLLISKNKNKAKKLKRLGICAGFLLVLVVFFFSGSVLQVGAADGAEETTASAGASGNMPLMQLESAEPEKAALGVSPVIIELILERGRSTEKKITVFNITNFPLPVKGNTESFFVLEDVEPGAEEIFDVSSWVSIEPADFILQPREHKEVKISIDVPPEAEPGGHYASIYFQPLIPVEVLSPQTAFLTARVGTLGFFVVQGEIVEKAELGELEVRTLQQFGPVDFKFPIRNAGNVHLLPAGEVIITGFLGNEKEKLEISPSAILPQTTKEITAQWDKKYLFGKFSVEVNISYGSENKKLVAGPVDFWVVPWLSLLIGGSLLTAVLVFCIMFRRRVGLALTALFNPEKLSEKERRGINLLPRKDN
ncbi:MAG: hypothetical protein U9M98_02290 [Patescibacteria group bacterium]|nr:hypothetical protein [Patescibacteria group bacterium]